MSKQSIWSNRLEDLVINSTLTVRFKLQTTITCKWESSRKAKEQLETSQMSLHLTVSDKSQQTDAMLYLSSSKWTTKSTEWNLCTFVL